MQVEAIIAGESTSQRPPTSGKRRLLTPTRPISIKPIPPPPPISQQQQRQRGESKSKPFSATASPSFTASLCKAQISLVKEKLSPKLCTSSSTADSVCYCSFPAFCDCIGALCLLSCFCSPEFSSGHPLSVCHQHLSSCLIYLRAPSLFCQEPLFSSTGPSLFNLPRDSLLQL